MKTKKKILSLILSIALVLSLLPTSAVPVLAANGQNALTTTAADTLKSGDTFEASFTQLETVSEVACYAVGLKFDKEILEVTDIETAKIDGAGLTGNTSVSTANDRGSASTNVTSASNDADMTISAGTKLLTLKFKVKDGVESGTTKISVDTRSDGSYNYIVSGLTEVGTPKPLTPSDYGQKEITLNIQNTVQPEEWSITIEPIGNQAYTGKAVQPEVVVKDNAGKLLSKDTDYKVQYTNNIKVGEATVKVQAEKNGKKADATETFKIVDSYGILLVEQKINAIGTVTLDSEEAITEARSAYEELPEEVKARISNYNTLTAAEAALEKEKQAVADVMQKIDAIGEVTLDSEAAITEARNAYDKLSEASKKKVTNYSVLTDAEAALKELWKDDTITCYVRAEGDEGTVLPLTKVTMNKHEVPSFSSYAIKNGPDDKDYVSALHILLQALTDRGMTDELATVDIGSNGWITDMFGWGMDQLWCLNGIDAPVMSCNYKAQDGETYVFYQAAGNWGAGYGYPGYGFFGEFGPGQYYTEHSAIETTEMTKEIGEAADFKYLYTSSMHMPNASGACNNEDGYTTKVYVSGDGAEAVTDEDYREDIVVNKDGKFQVSFDKPGTYIVSARYYNPDGSRGASNAYCKVTVKDTYGIADLMQKIDAIGEVTLDSEAAITEARTAYDVLPEEVKARISNYETLTAAEATLEKEKQAVADVMQKIDAIGEVTLDSEAVITEARNAYDKLSETNKNGVTNYSVLTAAEAALKELWKNDNITCYVRAEGDNGTILPLTKVTMNKHEVPSFSSYAIKSGPDDKNYVSALHILLQALTDRGMTDELATVDIGSSGWITDMFGWGMDQLWCLNGIDAPVMSCNYKAQDGETYVFYQAAGNWGAGYGYPGYGFFGEFGPGQYYTEHSAIETTEMTKEIGEAADFKYLYTSSMHMPNASGACNNEDGYTTKVYVSGDGAEAVTDEDYREDIVVNKDGKFQVSFDKPGTYIVSARYYNPDGSRGASNAYCKVTVKDTYGIADLMQKIDAIGEVTPDSEAIIQEARTAYEALPEEVKARVSNYSTLTEAEASLQSLKAEIAAVIDKIDAIGTVTLDSETAIQEARMAYNELSDAQKARVTNLATLTTAEQTLEKLKGDAKAVADTEAAISSIITPITLDSEASIAKARASYDALSDENKAKITNYEVLTTAEATLAQLKADFAAAEAVDQKITAVGTVALDSKKAIAEARDAYNKLTDVQKQQVTKLATLTAAEDTYAKLVAEESAKAKEAEKKIDAIGKVTLDSEKAIKEARDAYDALHGDFKAQVTNYDTLTAAEKKLSDLKIDKAAEDAESKIDAIGKVTLDSEKAIKEARDTYDALPDAAKKKVNNYKSLTDAEKKLSDLKIDKKAEDAESKIDAIGKVSLDSEKAIKEARDAYDALSDAAKKKVNNYKTLTDAEKQLSDLKKAASGTNNSVSSNKNTNGTSTKNANNNTNNTNTTQKTAVKTGDTTNVMLPISMMLLAIVAAGFCLVALNRRKRNRLEK